MLLKPAETVKIMVDKFGTPGTNIMCQEFGETLKGNHITYNMSELAVSNLFE